MTRGVWEEQRRRVLEPLSFLRAVQLLPQRVLLRLSHLVSLSVIPCNVLASSSLRSSSFPAVAAGASTSSRAHARVASVFEELAYFATTMLSTRRILIIELNQSFRLK